MGNDAADKFLKGVNTLFLPSNVAKMPVVEYPPLDEKTINEIQARAVQKGTEEGLQILKDAEKQYDVISYKKTNIGSPIICKMDHVLLKITQKRVSDKRQDKGGASAIYRLLAKPVTIRV
ncbi:MAG: hypothetical protein WA125_12940 [Desulfosporosinus sp.]